MIPTAASASALTDFRLLLRVATFFWRATTCFSVANFESGLSGSSIHGFGDALFFSTAQIVTVSSSFSNPVTHAGQIVDVILELWGIFVVAAVAGSFASFFLSGDQGPG